MDWLVRHQTVQCHARQRAMDDFDSYMQPVPSQSDDSAMT